MVIQPKYQSFNKDGALNPFVLDVKFEYFEHYRIALVTGEVTTYHSDRASGIKFYQLSREMEDAILNLSSGGKNLLFLIIFNLGVGHDRIALHINKYMKRMGITEKSFYNAVKDLTDQNIIRKYKGSVYWINPKIIFNGDRLAKYADRTVCIGKINITPKNG